MNGRVLLQVGGFLDFPCPHKNAVCLGAAQYSKSCQLFPLSVFTPIYTLTSVYYNIKVF